VEVLLELEVDEVHLPGETQHPVQPPLRLAREHHVSRLRPQRREPRHRVHRVADVWVSAGRTASVMANSSLLVRTMEADSVPVFAAGKK
jgi:hypothetical protein